MRRALHAEWTKLHTQPAARWLILGVVALTVVAGAAASAAAGIGPCPAPALCFGDSTRLSLSGVWLGQVAAAALGVAVFATEHTSGTLRATLAATPRRFTVLAAKATVVATATAVPAAIAVIGSLAAGRALLPREGFNAPAGGYTPVPLEEPTLRAAVGTVIYLVLVAVLALGTAAAVRDGAAALTAVLALLYTAPALGVFVTDPQWQQLVQRLAPMPAGLSVQATERIYALAIGPWAGLGVLACYTAAALVAGALLFARRDA